MRIVGNPPSGGKKPTTPTIGTATDGGTGTTVSVAFTPSTYIGKGTITYTALSSPGSLTGTGSGSPITVSGLTTGTAYTFTVKGDTNYGVASDYSAASNSVTPASPSSFESIATSTPTSGSSITFSSIPQTYSSLQIRALLKGSSSVSDVAIRINGVTTGSYIWHRVQGNGSTILASTSGVGETAIRLGSFGSTQPGGLILDINNYTSTTQNKTVRSFSGYDANGSGIVSLYGGLFVNTAAITSITVINQNTSFASGTTIALYGIKG